MLLHGEGVVSLAAHVSYVRCRRI